MSWDASMVIDTGGDHPATVEYIGSCAPGAWHYVAFKNDSGIRILDGLAGAKAVPVVIDAVAYMTVSTDGHDEAMAFLKTLLSACLRHPKATVRIS